MYINEQGRAIGSWDGHGDFLYRDGRTLAFDDLLEGGSAGRFDELSLSGINDAGQIIGNGYRREPLGWEAHAFLANPVPELAAVAQLLCGLGMLGWIACRRPVGAANSKGTDPTRPAARPQRSMTGRARITTRLAAMAVT